MTSISDVHNNIFREPATVQEAEEFLWHVSSGLGRPPGPVADELQESSARMQIYVKELQQGAKKDMEKVVEDIYTQDSRYLYELIQNADDASYQIAAEQHEIPSLTFTLDRKHLLVDSNEDGFTAANVTAVCSVSESSKKLSSEDDSIGEKGIGFKSVFNIARNVRIQSGLWSFEFDNKPEESLSMVIPIPVAHQELPRGVRTRIALQYYDGKAQEIAHALRALPDNTITFLRRVMRLEIVRRNIPASSSLPASRRLTKHYEANSPISQALTLESILQPHAEPDSRSTQKHYLLFKKTYSDLPQDKKRRRTHAEVQLAFPVTPDGQDPLVTGEGEDVFAFLPTSRQRGIPFIIQSDFITLINRESVVSCPWNHKLREYVMQTFVAAVTEWLRHNYVYQWLEYLPKFPTDGFWEPLPKAILERLKVCRVLKPYSGGSLASPSKLSILPECFVHNNEALLDDSESPTVYLSPEYSNRGYGTKLRDLGLRELTWTQIIDRVEKDLNRGDSKVKNTTLQDEWHVRFSELIDEMLCGEISDTEKGRIWDLNFIPLRGGSWATPSQEVYFPRVGEQEIPLNLELKLVHPEGMCTGAQMSLYKTSGVSECNPDTVVNKILDFQLRKSKPWTGRIPVKTVLLHLQFLHFAGKGLANAEKRELLAVSTDNNLHRAVDGFYFPSTDPYDTQSLLRVVREKGVAGSNFKPGIILDDWFISEKRPPAYHHGRSWTQWLRDFALVRRYPPFVTVNDSTRTYRLSTILSKVQEADSALLLSTLHAHWSEAYESEYRNHEQDMNRDMRCRKVSCTHGISVELAEAFFPSTELNRIAEELGTRSNMPFVQLESTYPNQSEWRFLSNFGVQFDSSLDFWLKSISALRKDESLGLSEKRDSARRVYENIGLMVNLESQERIRKFFQDQPAVYCGGDDTDWTNLSECLWQGPSFIKTRKLLHQHYQNSHHIKHLFVDILAIRDANQGDVFSELRSMKANDRWRAMITNGDLDLAEALFTQIYEALDQRSRESAGRRLTENFEERLIFVQGEWFKPSECVWDHQLADLGIPKLREPYNDLKAFFVEKLGVPTVTGSFLVKELQRLAMTEDTSSRNRNGAPTAHDNLSESAGDAREVSGSNVEHYTTDDTNSDHVGRSIHQSTETTISSGHYSSIKQIMLQLALMIGRREVEGDAEFEEELQKLKQTSCMIFPVLDAEGYLSVQAQHEPFFVNDHVRWGQKFANKVDMLDFSCEESNKLKWLLEKFDLQTRYLSAQVNQLSEPQAPALDQRITEDFRKRSYALSCYAASCGSRKYFDTSKHQQRNDRLLGANLYTSEDLRTTLRLDLGNGQHVTERSDQAVATIHGLDAGQIDIYLPAAQEDLERCYRTSLPKQLQALLGIEDASAKHVLCSLLTVRLHHVYRELEDSGVPYLDSMDKIELPEPEAPDQPEEGQPALPIHSSTPPSQAQYRDNSEYTQPEAEFVLPIRASSVAPDGQRIDNNEYSQLLSNIVEAARGRPSGSDTVPYRHVSRALAFGTSGDDPTVLSRIGAAGELFVFETLSWLQIPDFGFENWQSSVRHFAESVDGYRDMPPWRGPDLDIVIKDGTGRVEQWLRRHSYDDFPAIPLTTRQDGQETRRRVKFVLEVKTTLGLCSDRMFMSNRQYERMHANRMDSEPWTGTVFVLVRVYGLLERQPQILAFVDPARLEGGALHFNSQKWEVVAHV
ncbi:MAG: hypothetical protein M1831_004116 [Alyxoria varia]|nr:MAG: hypothetical protein M1831_004116 [Alyxoria varia]